MKEALAGFLLMCLVVPLALLGYLIICYAGIFGRVERGRAGVRALDQFVNATVFKGYAWESISSHAWRERERQAWARWVIKLTNIIQLDHCKRANKREQVIVDLVIEKGLHRQTIK